MFAAKTVQVNASTGGRDRLIIVLTIAIITLAFGAILCSCGGGGGVKGHNNNNDLAGSKSSSFMRSPGYLGRLSRVRGQNYGRKTLSKKGPTSRITKPLLVQRARVDGSAEPKERLERREQPERIVPSLETNGNSQVVYVNLARVVSDKNETERVINRQPIKQDGQIGCGETNRLGVPSNVPSNETLQNRIVGGNKAEPGEFPYQVRLNIRSRRGSSLCGGVIIDKRHILTAAHCMTTW